VTSDSLEEFAKTFGRGFLHSAGMLYSLEHKDLARIFVRDLYWELGRLHGDEAARKMFAPYGRALNNKDKTISKNTRLILELYDMRKPSISGLAKKKADGNGKAVEAWRKQIHRALNDKAAWDEAWDVADAAGFDREFWGDFCRKYFGTRFSKRRDN
jgi:hypothetical protein